MKNKIIILGSIFFVNSVFANSIVVEDQSVMDGGVMAKEVKADESGWLVVHRADESGAPGPTIGHAAVEQGDNMDVVVKLDESVDAGPLIFMLHVDKGEMGVYEFSADNKADVPATADDKVVMSLFNVE